MDFPKIKLSLLAKITAGQNAPQNQADYGTEGYPFIKAAHMQALSQGVISEQECLRVSDAVARRCKLKVSKAGSIVFAKSGMSCMKGYVHALAQDVYLVNHLACVTITASERLTSQYLAYYFRKHSPSRLAKDEGYPSISLSDIGNLEIPLPPLAEQERIAAELDAVVATLKKRQTQLAELDALVESRFVELFGALGINPNGFPERIMSDVCQINPKKNSARLPNDDFLVSFVPMSAVSERGELDASNVRPYCEVKKGFTYFEENDVLFAKITPCMENGKGAVARRLKNGVGFGSTEFHTLRPTAGVSNPFWLYQITAFEQFRGDAEKKMTGSAGQRRVPAAFLENYRVALPPFELQERFAAEVERVEAIKAKVRAGIAETQTLFDALTQRYFG